MRALEVNGKVKVVGHVHVQHFGMLYIKFANEDISFGPQLHISFTKISEREVRIATKNFEKCDY